MILGLPWTVFAEFMALGAIGGLLAGLLGVGGGMVLVPFTSILLARQGVSAALTLKIAVATSLATICFTAVSSVRAHQKRGAVRWDVVRRLAPGIVVGAIAGAQLAKWIPSGALTVLFSGFLAFSATQMLLDLKPKGTRDLPGPAGMAGVGGAVGVVSSLVGAGGAFMTVPFMAWCNVAMHHAVGTASALGLPIALAGTLGFAVAGWSQPGLPPGALGFVFLPALAALASASVLTAPLGAWAAHQLNVRQLKRVFALMLYAVAATMMLRS